jgi:hypothetical protein
LLDRRQRQYPGGRSEPPAKATCTGLPATAGKPGKIPPVLQPNHTRIQWVISFSFNRLMLPGELSRLRGSTPYQWRWRGVICDTRMRYLCEPDFGINHSP